LVSPLLIFSSNPWRRWSDQARWIGGRLRTGRCRCRIAVVDLAVDLGREFHRQQAIGLDVVLVEVLPLAPQLASDELHVHEVGFFGVLLSSGGNQAFAMA
jgi:hypothetical protein